MELAGCFAAAIVADSAGKHEVHPSALCRTRILVADIEACTGGGDVARAPRGGTLTRERVHADLAELAAGRKPRRLSPDELVVYDSTGSGAQDVAAAWTAYQEAVRTGRGTWFDLAGGSSASGAAA